jgi:hypothetical protein
VASVYTHASMHACVYVLFPCDTRSWGVWLGFYRAEVPIQKREEEGDSNRLIGGGRKGLRLWFSRIVGLVCLPHHMIPSVGRRIPVGRDASTRPHIWPRFDLLTERMVEAVCCFYFHTRQKEQGEDRFKNRGFGAGSTGRCGVASRLRSEVHVLYA